MGEKFDRAGDAFCFCFGDIAAVASIVVWRVAHVPAFNTVRRPRAAYLRCFMDKDFGAGGGHGRLIEVECAVHVRFS